jgi:hypothetical protein
MFSEMIRYLPCSSCESGVLYYNQEETFEAWKHPEMFRLEDVDKIKDGIVSDVLVMVCNQCGAQVRYTFKEIEKEVRKKLSKRLLTLLSKGYIQQMDSDKTNRVYVYCGKCTGYDGKGSCLKYIYDNCMLKKTPVSF